MYNPEAVAATCKKLCEKYSVDDMTTQEFIFNMMSEYPDADELLLKTELLKLIAGIK
jgi:hypothetical protein